MWTRVSIVLGIVFSLTGAFGQTGKLPLFYLWEPQADTVKEYTGASKNFTGMFSIYLEQEAGPPVGWKAINGVIQRLYLTCKDKVWSATLLKSTFQGQRQGAAWRFRHGGNAFPGGTTLVFNSGTQVEPPRISMFFSGSTWPMKQSAPGDFEQQIVGALKWVERENAKQSCQR